MRCKTVRLEPLPPPHLKKTQCAIYGDLPTADGGTIFFFMYVIQLCFICRPSDSTVSEDVGIEPRTVATLALAARGSNKLSKSHPNL
jgi:hypothetical protein